MAVHDRVDVDSVDDLPAAPAGQRWVDFLGGTRNLRCYLVGQDVVRHELMTALDDLDPVHDPVFAHAGVTVRQDSSYALPGFYVAALDGHVPALDGADEAQTIALALTVRDVRRAMRVVLRIGQVHLHHEEKPQASSHVHQWLLPVHAQHAAGSTTLMRLDLHRYLSGFVFREQRSAILAANEHVRAHLDAIGTRERLDAALAGLSRHQRAALHDAEDPHPEVDEDAALTSTTAPGGTPTPHRVLVGEGDSDLDRRLSAELDTHNTAATPGIDPARELTVQVLDSTGALVAGLSGWTWGTAAGITMTWVHTDARGAGHGARLLREFEDAASSRGCTHIFTTSFTFQAPDFYRRAGYRDLFRWDDLPSPGAADVHLRKDLT